MNVYIQKIGKEEIAALKLEQWNVTDWRDGSASVKCDDSDVDDLVEFCDDFDLECEIT